MQLQSQHHVQSGHQATTTLIKRHRLTPYSTDMNTAVLQLSHHRRDVLRLNDCFRGIFINGSTGAGKSTMLAGLMQNFLKLGVGACFFSTKPGDAADYIRMAALAGRSQDVIHWTPDSSFRLNILDYAVAMDLAANGEMRAFNVVNLLMNILEAAQRGNELRGKGAEQPFWRYAPRALLDHTIDVLWAAYGTLRLADIVQFILTAPSSEAEFHDSDFRNRSFHMKSMHKLVSDPVHPMSDHDASVAMDYFRYDFGRLDGRTKSNIVQTLTSQLAPLLKGMLHRCFCTDTTVAPDLSFTAGAILIVDFPVKTYGDAGLLASHIIKLALQNAVEARDIRVHPRPVVLVADEATNYISVNDLAVQATARSSRLCTIYLTQSISHFYTVIGGNTPKEATHAFLNNFNFKLFLACNDFETNQFAAELIGKRIQMRKSVGTNSGSSFGTNNGSTRGVSFQSGSNWSNSEQGGKSSGGSSSSGWSESDSVGHQLGQNWGNSHSSQEQMDYAIQPGEFATLRNGPDNGWYTDAVIVEGGRRFHCNGRHHLTASFPMVLL